MSLFLAALLAAAPAASKSSLVWLEVYASPNPVEGDQVPVFSGRLSQAADAVELRIHTMTLELRHAKEFAKPTRQTASGEAIYEYAWPGINALPKGVYFFIFRAIRVKDKALAGKASRCGEAEFKSGRCQAVTEMKSLKVVR